MIIDWLAGAERDRSVTNGDVGWLICLTIDLQCSFAQNIVVENFTNGDLMKTKTILKEHWWCFCPEGTADEGWPQHNILAEKLKVKIRSTDKELQRVRERFVRDFPKEYSQDWDKWHRRTMLKSNKKSRQRDDSMTFFPFFLSLMSNLWCEPMNGTVYNIQFPFFPFAPFGPRTLRRWKSISIRMSREEFDRLNTYGQFSVIFGSTLSIASIDMEFLWIE